MVDCINQSDILFAIGPAGTGENLYSCKLSGKGAQKQGRSKEILTRASGRSRGEPCFLPGDLKEKIDSVPATFV